jgi:MFS family permease
MLEAEAEHSRLRDATVGGVYPWYVLGVLFLVYVVNFIDRQILSILAQDIKLGLGLSDAELGFLYGTAFAIFYSLFGIPLGRLADGWYRGRLIALGLGTWSAMTALSGLASSYAQLATARVGVGVGEASASPAAYSLLCDYFPRERRALVLAIYSSGLFVGAGLSLPIGGSVAHAWSRHFASGGAPFGLAGWQAAFLAVGIPGLLLAAWVLTLREPPRGVADGHPTPACRPGVWRDVGREIGAILPPLTLWSVARIPGGLRVNLMLLAVIVAAAALLIRLTGDVLQWVVLAVGVYAVASFIQQLRSADRPAYTLLWGTPTVVLALSGFGLVGFVSYSVGFWVPPYAMRTFHIGPDVAGLMIGVPFAFASAAGCVLGGRLADVWRRRDPRGRIFVCMLAMALEPPIGYALVSTGDVHTFYLLSPLLGMLTGSWVGVAAATTQDCVLPRMRGTAGATFLLAVSLIGLALGPYFGGTPLALYVLWLVARGLPLAEATKAARARQCGEQDPVAAV